MLVRQCWKQLYITGPLLKVYIFSGSFGSFGSAVDDQGANEPNEHPRLVDD